MEKGLFRGAGVAIVTPFTEQGINFSELARLIEFQIEQGTDAIVITGTTGEAATMTEEEHQEAIAFTVRQVAGRIPVIAGTGSNCTKAAIAMSQFAERAGADALLVVTPYYNKCTQKGLAQHFTAVADAVKIPLILYNVPSRTGVCIRPETYEILSKHPRIAAAKEASGDLSAIAQIRCRCGEDLVIYSGNDDQIVPILSLGGQGVISVLSNVAPKAVHDMCAAYFAGQAEKAGQMQLDYLPLIKALFMEVNPIPVKTALRLLGYAAGPLRLPLCEMEEVHRTALKDILQKYKLLAK